MKNITRHFSPEVLEALKKQVGIELVDSHDYSEDELGDIYDQITEEFPYGYSGEGIPTRMGQIFEEIVDTFLELGIGI